MIPSGSVAVQSLVIMAAGASSRFGRLKQLEAVGPMGETLLEYSIYDAVAAGVSSVVMVVRPESESAFRRQLAPATHSGVKITYVRQEDPSRGGTRTRPWGTGHALLCARDVLPSSFGVINADDFYGRASFELLVRNVDGSVAENAVIAFRLASTLSLAGGVNRGICVLDEHGRLERIEETLNIIGHEGTFSGLSVSDASRVLAADSLVSMNMWRLTSNLLASMEDRWLRFVEVHGESEDAEFYIPDVVSEEIRERALSVAVIPSTAIWYGLTYSDDVLRVRSALRQMTARGEYPTPLWK